MAFVSASREESEHRREANVQKVPQKQLNRFCANLKRLRSDAGLSQEALAERSEISTRYLQFIEAGKFGTSFAVLLRLRRALDCAWDDLLEGLG